MRSILAYLNGVGFQELFALVLIIGFCFMLFLALRAVVLWYWKINEIVNNQQQQIRLLTDLLKETRKNSIGQP
jgi:CHASE3 domain sensor protein